MALTAGIYKILTRSLYVKPLLHRQNLSIIPVATFKDIKYPPPSFHDVEMPEVRELPDMPRIPHYYINNKPPRLRKYHTQDLRGPERIQNTLHYKQYGLMALSPGYITYQLADVISHTVNRRMDKRRMFAIWRVDPLWKPMTKKPVGSRMGGGKPNVHHYSSPVKAGRVIIEVGGKVEYEEVYPFLNAIAKKMPFDVIPISQKILDDIEKEAEDLHKKNINPFNFLYVVNNRMQGCQHWVSYWDAIHGADYI